MIKTLLFSPLENLPALRQYFKTMGSVPTHVSPLMVLKAFTPYQERIRSPPRSLLLTEVRINAVKPRNHSGQSGLEMSNP